MPESSLGTVQSFLVEVFQRPDEVTADANVARACGLHVSGNERLSPAEQVDIYRRQFWLRHIDSLVEDYPGTQYVLGEEAFDSFCRAYLSAHPPCTPMLRDLGADIVPFAMTYAAFPADRRELALDVLRYEHAFVDIFDGPDAPPVSAEKLASLPASAWETARIVLHPLLVTMTVHHAVHALRFAVKAGETPELPPREPAPLYLVLFRQDDVIRFDVVTEEAHRLLDALRGGMPLVPACSALVAGKSGDEAAQLQAEVGTWFQRWARSGWIVDVVS